MVEYRGHTSFWQLAKTGSLILLALGMTAYNGYRLYQGASTHSITSLERRSQEVVMFDTDPHWFVINVAIRLVIVLSGLGWMWLIWKQRMQPELRDF